MIRFSALSASIAAVLGMLAVPASAVDTEAPTITLDVPANGLELEGSRVSISGEVTDTSNDENVDPTIWRVQYRIEGYRRWRTATLVTPGEASSTYFFRVSLKKKQKRRIYVRAYDNAGNGRSSSNPRNESDIIGRRLRRGRK